ncbi:hypothetical protein KPE71_16145 [Acinetobacter soli]|uniref:hypothetical protein n=1 Tax=Acinetobacter soli TaxID=487316 RepID=UPI001C0CF0F0|nr:hypothetical protein [Acinetobacter soli]MBU3121761.1 hypothetical protein [Acinetobacter soli]
MNNKFLFCILVSALFTGCSNFSSQENVRYDRASHISASETDIVSSEIFKEIFDKNASAFQKNVSSFCLSTSTNGSNTDPSNAVISLFAGHSPQILPASECINKAGGVVDKFGKRAILFHVSDLKKNANGSYEAQAGYYEGNLSSQTNTYNAKKVNGKWKVNLVEMGPVS